MIPVIPFPDGLFGQKQWYVIRSKPGDERRAGLNLSNQKIETLLPLFESYQFIRGTAIRKIRPLFPNYLFAKLNLERHYEQVKWTRGVSRILGFGEGPAPVSEKVIQTIQERMGNDNLVRLEEDWKQGDLVCITSGPLKDLIGIFDRRLSDQGRVRILLNLIGVDVPVQLPKWQIKKVA